MAKTKQADAVESAPQPITEAEVMDILRHLHVIRFKINDRVISEKLIIARPENAGAVALAWTESTHRRLIQIRNLLHDVGFTDRGRNNAVMIAARPEKAEEVGRRWVAQRPGTTFVKAVPAIVADETILDTVKPPAPPESEVA